MPDSSSLTDREWEILEPLLPKKKRTRPPKWSKREILNGILYPLKNGCNWCDLRFGLSSFLYSILALQTVERWGSYREHQTYFTRKNTPTGQKKAKWTTLIIIDSQAVKNTCNASVKSKGFCFYKATNGIQRHLAVDTLGFPFFVHCTQASVSDALGLIEMLSDNIDYFKSKPVNIPQITILLDHGSHPEKIIMELKKIAPGIWTKIRFKLSPKPSKAQKKELGQTGFVPVRARWVIERTNSWMERCKGLVKNFERTLNHANAKISLCFVRLMLKRLAIA